MTESSAEKKLKESTGVLCNCGGTMFPIRIDPEYGCTDYECESCKNGFSIFLDFFKDK